MLDVGRLAHTIGAVLADIDRAEAVVEDLGRALADDPKWGHRILAWRYAIAVNVNDPTVITPPWGGAPWQLGGALQAMAEVVAILIVAFVVIRVAHVFVRGTARAFLRRENIEGTARELTAIELKKRQDTIEILAVNVIRLFVLVIAGLMILETGLGLDIGPAIAGLGIVGIAIGLGTQHLVRDYLNGALILMENQFAIGDIVRVAGVSGQVEDFTLRRTTLRDTDGTVHTVPNGDISVASNLTRVFGRVNVEVQIVYGTDVDEAIAVVNRLGQAMAEDQDWGPRILEAPKVDRVSGFGDFGVTLAIVGKVHASEQWAVAGEVRRRLVSAFKTAGIQMRGPNPLP